jgi:hypothetical protein
VCNGCGTRGKNENNESDGPAGTECRVRPVRTVRAKGLSTQQKTRQLPCWVAQQKSRVKRTFAFQRVRFSLFIGFIDDYFLKVLKANLLALLAFPINRNGSTLAFLG